MGDRGAHTLDMVYWAMKLTAPTSIDATSCGNTTEVHPLSAIVTYRFPQRAEMPPLKLTWYEGTRPPRPDELEDAKNLLTEGDGHRLREMIIHDRAVHFLKHCHTTPPYGIADFGLRNLKPGKQVNVPVLVITTQPLPLSGREEH